MPYVTDAGQPLDPSPDPKRRGMPLDPNQTVTLTLDLDAARDLLAAAFAGRHHAYVDLARLDQALQSAQRQLKHQIKE